MDDDSAGGAAAQKPTGEGVTPKTVQEHGGDGGISVRRAGSSHDEGEKGRGGGVGGGGRGGGGDGGGGGGGDGGGGFGGGGDGGGGEGGGGSGGGGDGGQCATGWQSHAPTTSPLTVVSERQPHMLSTPGDRLMKYRLHRSCDRPWQGQGGSPGKQRDTQFSDEAVDMPARQQLSAVGKSTQLSHGGEGGEGGVVQKLRGGELEEPPPQAQQCCSGYWYCAPNVHSLPWTAPPEAHHPCVS